MAEEPATPFDGDGADEFYERPEAELPVPSSSSSPWSLGEGIEPYGKNPLAMPSLPLSFRPPAIR